jgi:hypothetical protein
MTKILVVYQFKKIHQPIIAKGAITDEVISRLEEFGKTLAAGCEAGIF